MLRVRKQRGFAWGTSPQGCWKIENAQNRQLWIPLWGAEQNARRYPETSNIQQPLGTATLCLIPTALEVYPDYTFNQLPPTRSSPVAPAIPCFLHPFSVFPDIFSTSPFLHVSANLFFICQRFPGFRKRWSLAWGEWPGIPHYGANPAAARVARAKVVEKPPLRA